ncbi:MAG: hypothetical protein JST16_19025 [Bdellovibrionales bacterium]|nr:hypothetical protein [Bdellovibrionales bacterium]
MSKYARLWSISLSSLLLSFGAQAATAGPKPAVPKPAVPKPAAACTVPVCDIPGTLAKYKAMSAEDRQRAPFKYIQQLKVTYKKSQDVAVWMNLKEFAAKARDLFKQLGDEDWVIQNAADLLDQSVLALCKYGPVETKFLVDNFKLLSNEDSRFEILSYWVQRVPFIEDEVELRALIAFASQARAIALAAEDSDWVITAAKNVQNLGTQRIILLEPYHEGYYRVTTKIQNPNTVPQGCRIPRINVLMIANTQSDAGTTVNFVDADSETVYVFPNASIRTEEGAFGEILEGENYIDGIPSRYQIKVDRNTGAVNALLTTTHDSCVMSITGKSVRSVAEFFNDGPVNNPPAIEDVPGYFVGTMHGIPGTLIIRKLEGTNGQLLAGTFRWDSNELVAHIDLNEGAYIKKRAFVMLEQKWDRNGTVIWYLAKRVDSFGKEIWRGFGMSTLNGELIDLKFRRQAPVDEIPGAPVPANPNNL